MKGTELLKINSGLIKNSTIKQGLLKKILNHLAVDNIENEFLFDEKDLAATGKTFIGEIAEMAKTGFGISSPEAVEGKNGNYFFRFFKGDEEVYLNVSKGAIDEYGTNIAALSALPIYRTPVLTYVRDANGNKILDGSKANGKVKFKLKKADPVDGVQPVYYIVARSTGMHGISEAELLALATEAEKKSNFKILV